MARCTVTRTRLHNMCARVLVVLAVYDAFRRLPVRPGTGLPQVYRASTSTDWTDVNLLSSATSSNELDFVGGIFPDKDLVTYRTGRRALTRLVMIADRLDRSSHNRSDEDQEARSVVVDVLLSPLLRTAL
jgi:hypothetical protein